ncbi:hypothetical protein RI367_006021 [Sorochytrium milnesiophthora]
MGYWLPGLSLQTYDVANISRSLPEGLLLGCMLSFLCGLVWAVVALINDALPQKDNDLPNTSLWNYLRTLLMLQGYFHAVVIVQRLHIVNAYKIDSSIITWREFMSRWWPELALTAWLVSSIVVLWLPSMPFSIDCIGLFGLAAIIVIDFCISYYSLSKVHRMLNTRTTVTRWAWAAVTYRPPALGPLPSLADVADRADKLTIRRILRTWILLVGSVACACGFLSIAWTQQGVFASLLFTNPAMRGTMLYVEAVKHVMLENRKSKQYLGKTTRSGIQGQSKATSDIPMVSSARPEGK